MKTISRRIALAVLAGLLSMGSVSGQAVGGKFYGVHWDGSVEHFVTLDPFTGVHTSLGVVPGVQWIDATFRVFDPDSGLFGFIGGGSNAMNYQIIDVATGGVVQTFPRNDNLKNPSYDPGTGLIYGTWWSDSSVARYDTLPGIDSVVRHPDELRGTEYFSAINPRTGARTDTPIPGLLYIAASSHFFDSDSGRYVLYGGDTANRYSYYVIDVTDGQVISQVPVSFRIDFAVYNPVMGAVHGLWWSDSTEETFDTLGHPMPAMPHQIKGAEYFVTIHQDSTIDLVELPGVKYISNFNRTIDTDSGRYVFTGSENGSAIRYYVIDVATGAILSNTLAPARAVDHLVYAPLHSETYGNIVGIDRSAATRRSPAAWTLRQDIFGAELSFSNPESSPHAFSLVDMSGKTVLRQEGIRNERVNIRTTDLKAGLYVFTLRNAVGRSLSGKLVVK